MTELTVLIEGYAHEQNGVWHASSSTVLIKNSGPLIVDPGSNKERLLKALAENKLTPKDIHRVFVTHYHLDHSLNLGLFPNAEIYDATMRFKGDMIVSYNGGKLSDTNIQVIDTPGHSPEHASLLVETDQGKIAIAGDVFWWQDDEAQKTDRGSLLEHHDQFAKHAGLLRQSRQKLLELANYIIPGHGQMFPVK